MIGTSIGAATDYLVATAATAVVGILAGTVPVTVVDGWPPGLTDAMFVIGLEQSPPEATDLSNANVTATRAWAALGAKHAQEDYTIPCYIDIRIAGDVQKTARDIALSIFNAFWALIAADLTLGGALQGGRFAEIDDLTCTPTNLGTAAQEGRRQFISFSVRCRNLTN